MATTIARGRAANAIRKNVSEERRHFFTTRTVSSYYVSTFNICISLEGVAKDYTWVIIIVGWGQL